MSGIYIYGCSRLGLHHINKVAATTAPGGPDLLRPRGYRRHKSYELTNHLGNVLTTISDLKQGSDDDMDGLADIYHPHLASWADYYPFGMEMAGRTGVFGNTSRFGFNGKEKDPSISSLTHYDYGFRVYNPAVGRFLSVDPLSNKFPNESPFNYAGNNPIANLDIEGMYKLPAAAKYSKLANYLQNGINDLLQNKDIRAGLRLIGGFTDDQINSKLATYGEGIEIEILQLDNDELDHAEGIEINGHTIGSNKIQIDEILVQQLQNATSPEEESAALLGVISTILHETTHAGQREPSGWNSPDKDGLWSKAEFFNKNTGSIEVNYFFKGVEVGSSLESGDAFETGIWDFNDIEYNTSYKKQGDKGMHDQKFRYSINEYLGKSATLPKMKNP